MKNGAFYIEDKGKGYLYMPFEIKERHIYVVGYLSGDAFSWRMYDLKEDTSNFDKQEGEQLKKKCYVNVKDMPDDVLLRYQKMLGKFKLANLESLLGIKYNIPQNAVLEYLHELAKETIQAYEVEINELVTCYDNTGLEDELKIGESYKLIMNKGEIMVVESKNGKRFELLADRFKKE